MSEGPIFEVDLGSRVYVNLEHDYTVGNIAINLEISILTWKPVNHVRNKNMFSN